MSIEEKLEFLLLCELKKYVNDLTSDEWKQFVKTYNVYSIEKRSKELTDKFLEPYVILKA